MRQRNHHIGGRRRRGERGSLAMFIVVFLTILATIPLGMSLIQISNRKTSQQIASAVQSDNVARAGLVEAIAWFRRQPTQPVRATSNPTLYPWADAPFYPRTSTNTATADTLDETIGLVKEYSLSDSDKTWGRFEVRRQQNTSTNPVNPSAVHDISERRIETAGVGTGQAWYIESEGIVYRRRDASKAYNVSPNEVVSRSRAATEIRRIAIILPTNAAVCVTNRHTVTLTNGSKIRGGTSYPGLGYYQGTAGTTSSGSSITGSGTGVLDIDGSGSSGSVNISSVFGVTQNELKLMADYTVASVNELPVDYPNMAVVFISGDASFNSVHQLRGGGILYVNGNLTLGSDANSLFSGLIFVTGNCTINGPALISGCLIGQGSLTMDGATDVPEIDFDSSILDAVRQQVAQYRENKSVYYTFSGTQ